jgi:hypothetical protein
MLGNGIKGSPVASNSFLTGTELCLDCAPGRPIESSTPNKNLGLKSFRALYEAIG